MPRAGLIHACIMATCIVSVCVVAAAAGAVALPGAVLSAHAQGTASGEDSVAIIETGMGTIIIEFFAADAPGHVENFVQLSEADFYDGTLFHRIIPGFMIQGGDPNTIEGPDHTWGTGGPDHTVPAEFNDIMHDRGIVSMARSQHPDSAGSQFFIVHRDSHFLDGQYTAFGRVITQAGLQTLDAIAEVQTGAQDRPTDPGQVRILDVTITDRSDVKDALDLAPPARTVLPPSLAPPTGSQEFESERLGISFEAPAGWLLQEPGLTQPGAPDVVAVGPQQGGGIPQVYIYVHDTNQTSLGGVVDERVAAIRAIISDDDFATLLQDDATVSGLPARMLEVTESVSIENRTIDVKLVEFITYHDGRTYTISYANLPHVFDDALPDFEEMLDTFEIFAAVDMETPEEEEDLSAPTPATTPTEEAPAVEPDADDNGGGCLIATAAFGSEMAPQVQALRELRDGTIMPTQSGAAFMAAFNTIYYSFSPYVADAEREHPVLRDAVRIIITPMISSLYVMTHADSEHDIVAYGMMVILFNAGLYVAAPAVALVAGARLIRPAAAKRWRGQSVARAAA